MERIEMTHEALTELNRKIAVMQAYRDGKEIQHKYVGKASPGLNPDTSVWADSTPPHASPQWLWTMYDYRVKVKEPEHLYTSAAGGIYCEPTGVVIAEFIEITPEVRQKLGL